MEKEMTGREALKKVFGWDDEKIKNALEEIAEQERNEILDCRAVVIPPIDQNCDEVIYFDDGANTMISAHGEFWQTFEMGAGKWEDCAKNFLKENGFEVYE